MPEETLKQVVDRVKAAKTAIGNAITAKGGTVGANDGLEEYPADIATIPSGGIEPASPKDVNFYDYDGTCVYSYTADDFAELTEMPANPTHAGLTAQGWNWSLADAKAYVAKYGELIIGQLYMTPDGSTRIRVNLTDAYLTKSIIIKVNGEITIDWGDGSTETITGTNADQTITHTFPHAGGYAIHLTSSVNYNFSLVQTLDTDGLNNSVVEINFGEKAFINRTICYASYSLKLVTFPKKEWEYENLRGCANVLTLIFPYDSSLRRSFNLTSSNAIISFPKRMRISSISTFQGGKFSQCTLPEDNILPDSTTFAGVLLEKFVFTDSFSTINSTLKNCSSLGYIKFSTATPPSVSNSTSWSGIPSTCYILVPLNTLDDYLNETNMPDDSVYMYLCFAKYADGETLPTTSTDGYTLTWYATKDDARNAVNPITVGNGKEVYAVGV